MEKTDERDYSDITSYEVQGTKVYDLNKETGVLQMSISPGDLEIFLQDMDIPPEGKDLRMPLIGPGEYGTFKEVKKIESMPDQISYFFKMLVKK